MIYLVAYLEGNKHVGHLYSDTTRMVHKLLWLIQVRLVGEITYGFDEIYLNDSWYKIKEEI